jgi:hypothetical protein
MTETETIESQKPAPVALQPVVRPRPKYRVSDWLNTNTGEPVYGIQRNTEKGKWVNCACDGEALLYTKRETAVKHCRWLNDLQGTEPEWSKDSAV